MLHSMPAKNVDAVNTIKTDLKVYVEKLSKVERTDASYGEHHRKIMELLTKLGRLDINVSTLHVTKVGKMMSKYERDLPKELSDVASENNRRWKVLLNEYREKFKNRVYTKINEVEVKEEPLTQNSYNELLASQDTCDDDDGGGEDSYNLLLANSQDYTDSQVTRLHVPLTSTPMENNNIPSDVIDNTSKDFFADVRDVVTNVETTLSSVEMECTKMRTMIQYINEKLDTYEVYLHTTQHSTSSRNSDAATGVASVSKNCDVSKTRSIRDTFEKTGRAVMPRLYSPSTKSSVNNTTKTDHSTVSMQKPTCSLASSSRVGKPSTPMSSEISTKNRETKRNEIDETSTKTSTSPSSVYDKINHHKKTLSNCNATSNASSEPSIDIGYENEIEDMNPCASSNDDDETEITIKLEEPIASQDIEFYRHSCNGTERIGQSVERDDNLPPPYLRNSDPNVENTSKQNSNPSQKLKRKSSESDSNDMSRELMNSKISSICQKLKRKSLEEREASTKLKLITPEKQIIKSPRDGESSSKQIVKPRGESSSKQVTTKCRGESSKSSVFEIDSDGFAVPKMVNQNEIYLTDDTVLLKGAQVLGEEVGVNLDEVELEDFFTYSQVVNDMNEIDDIEKDYLLANKKNRTSWNNSCKSKEGIKYSPLLIKSKGRMKAAHKASVGKEVVYNMLNKNKHHK